MAILRTNRALEKFEREADQVAKRHIPFAVAKTLTALAQMTQRETVKQLRSKLDRPTPWTLNSIFLQRAERTDGDRMMAVVNVQDGNGQRRYADGRWPAMGQAFVATGSNKRAVLFQQFAGGKRQWKRFEDRLRKIGVLPAGLAAVPPAKSSWAVALDRYGNIPAGTIVKLLSYFQAFTEAGYSANATAAGRAKLAKKRQRKGTDYTVTSASGRTIKRGYIEIGGVVYFASGGRGSWSGRYSSGRIDQHLPAGIWAKRGIHGSDVAPVLLFVRQPTYQRRIDMPGIARDQYRNNFNRLFRQNLADAIKTAKR